MGHWGVWILPAGLHGNWGELLGRQFGDILPIKSTSVESEIQTLFVESIKLIGVPVLIK